MPILKKDDNISENFEFYKDENFILKEQDITEDYRNLVGKRLDIRSHIKDSLFRCTFQDKLLANELSLSLRKIRFNK